MKYCQNCGSKIENKNTIAKFCSNCGAPLSPDSKASVPNQSNYEAEINSEEKIPNISSLDIEVEHDFEICRKTTFAELVKEDPSVHRTSDARRQIKAIDSESLNK